MTYERSEMARSAFYLKAVVGVTAGFAVALAAVVLAFAPRPAWPVGLIVAGGVVLIALGMWAYAVRPGMFNGKPGVFGDPLRTEYHVEEQALLPREASPAPHRPGIPVSEHIYAWQSVRRVAPGEQVWTRSYVRLVVGQLALLVGAAIVLAVAGGGVALGLGALDDGTMCFVAAGIVLAVFFALSHRSGIIDAHDYATAPMAPLPDLTWRPGTTTDTTTGATTATATMPTSEPTVAATELHPSRAA